MRCQGAGNSDATTQNSLPEISNNLRDKTWNLQQKYVQHLQVNHNVDPKSWPDFDSFWPANSTSDAQAVRAKLYPIFTTVCFGFAKPVIKFGVATLRVTASAI